MARKKKNELPSGNVRIQVYDYTDDAGKKHYKSFTAPTRAQAQAKATEWKNHRRELKKSLTVSRACEKYIDSKRNVLSPSTITGYEATLRRIKRYPFHRIDLSVISNDDIQQFTSDLAATLSSKSVRNTIGLVTAAINAYMPSFAIHVTLPSKTKPKLYTPTAYDVQMLLNCCDTTELKLAILFAAVGTMRRGEACAVTFDDVNYQARTVEVNKDVVKANTGEWITKDPKTYESYRKIRMPQYIMVMIKSLDKGKRKNILGFTPSQLYDNFISARKRSGLPEFRYHDLRHYAASKMHAQGIPQRYIEAIGGWKPGSNVLKRIYQDVLIDEMSKFEEEFTEKNHFAV